MNSEMIDLAREAVDCEGWRWMPGMKVMVPTGGKYRLREGHHCLRGREVGYKSSVWVPSTRFTSHLPILTDPATLGCLLHLVREVWGDPGACCYPTNGGGWLCLHSTANTRRPTETHALVAALKAGGER